MSEFLVRDQRTLLMNPPGPQLSAILQPASLAVDPALPEFAKLSGHKANPNDPEKLAEAARKSASLQLVKKPPANSAAIKQVFDLLKKRSQMAAARSEIYDRIDRLCAIRMPFVVYCDIARFSLTMHSAQHAQKRVDILSAAIAQLYQASHRLINAESQLALGSLILPSLGGYPDVASLGAGPPAGGDAGAAPAPPEAPNVPEVSEVDLGAEALPMAEVSSAEAVEGTQSSEGANESSDKDSDSTHGKPDSDDMRKLPGSKDHLNRLARQMGRDMQMIKARDRLCNRLDEVRAMRETPKNREWKRGMVTALEAMVARTDASLDASAESIGELAAPEGELDGMTEGETGGTPPANPPHADTPEPAKAGTEIPSVPVKSAATPALDPAKLDVATKMEASNPDAARDQKLDEADDANRKLLQAIETLLRQDPRHHYATKAELKALSVGSPPKASEYVSAPGGLLSTRPDAPRRPDTSRSG